jgi:hypothetical protein
MSGVRWWIKFCFVFTILAVFLVPLKFSIDTCLGYEQARLFPRVQWMPYEVCSRVEAWDAGARTRMLTQVNQVGMLATAQAPKEAVSLTDVIFMWKIPANFPVYLSRIPGSFDAAQSVICWLIYVSAIVTLLWQSIAMAIAALERPRMPEEKPEDVQAGLRRDAIRRLLPDPSDTKPTRPEFSKRPFKRY